MYLLLLYLPVFLSFREKYLELRKLHENEEGQPEKGKPFFLPQCILLDLLQIGLLMDILYCVSERSEKSRWSHAILQCSPGPT